MIVFDDNIVKLDGYLVWFCDIGILNCIGGQDVVGSVGIFYFMLFVDKFVICDVVYGIVEDIDMVVKVVYVVFVEWCDMFVNEWCKVLICIVEGIEVWVEEIVFCECWDIGQVYKFMFKVVLCGVENFCYFVDQVVQVCDGQYLKSLMLMNIIMCVFIGFVGVIMLWNMFFMLLIWKIVFVLVVGCMVVYKFVEVFLFMVWLLVEIVEEVGLLFGVLNIVNGFGEGVGKVFCEYLLICVIVFVGESCIGSLIIKQGVDMFKCNYFEFGGKNFVIVFDDVDLDCVLDVVIFMIYLINGECCIFFLCFLVQDMICDEFEVKLIECVNVIKVGYLFDFVIEIGLFVIEEYFNKVISYFDIVKEDGVIVVVGGVMVGDMGYFVCLMLFIGVNNQMWIV